MVPVSSPAPGSALRAFSISRLAIPATVAAALTLGISPSFGQEYTIPEDYRVTEGRLAGGLGPCLEQAGGGYEAALSCTQSVFQDCLAEGPDGDATAGLGICSSVAGKILDNEMNMIWSRLKKDAAPAAFQDVLEEQRAWLKLRDSNAQAAAERYSGGSMGGYSGGIMHVGMTAERLARLHEIAAGL